MSKMKYFYREVSRSNGLHNNSHRSTTKSIPPKYAIKEYGSFRLCNNFKKWTEE